jgi:hypothetical protein
VVIAAVAVSRIAAILAFGTLSQPQLYEYGGIARHLLAGYGYATVYPAFHPDYGLNPSLVSPAAMPTAFTLPGGVMIMATVLWVAGDTALAYAILYALNVLFAIAAVWLAAGIAAELFNEKAGRWAAVAVAAYPPFMLVAARFGGTIWYHPAMCFAILLVLRAGRQQGFSLRSAVLAGAATALWIAFRGEALAIMVMLALWLRGRAGTRTAVIYILTTVSLISPWMLRNAAVFHRLVPMTTSGPLNLWRGNNPDATGGSYYPDGNGNWSTPGILAELRATPSSPQRELAMMDIYQRHAMDFLVTRPYAAGALFMKKLAMFVSIDWTDRRARHPLFASAQVLLSCMLVLACIVLARHRALPWHILGIIIFYAILVSAMHVETRYQLIVSVLSMVLVCGAASLSQAETSSSQA